MQAPALTLESDDQAATKGANRRCRSKGPSVTAGGLPCSDCRCRWHWPPPRRPPTSRARPRRRGAWEPIWFCRRGLRGSPEGGAHRCAERRELFERLQQLDPPFIIDGTVDAETHNGPISISGGSGTVDPTAGTATISWKGSFTLFAYSGMTFFSLSDPVLTITSTKATRLPRLATRSISPSGVRTRLSKIRQPFAQGMAGVLLDIQQSLDAFFQTFFFTHIIL